MRMWFIFIYFFFLHTSQLLVRFLFSVRAIKLCINDCIQLNNNILIEESIEYL